MSGREVNKSKSKKTSNLVLKTLEKKLEEKIYINISDHVKLTHTCDTADINRRRFL